MRVHFAMGGVNSKYCGSNILHRYISRGRLLLSKPNKIADTPNGKKKIQKHAGNNFWNVRSYCH